MFTVPVGKYFAIELKRGRVQFEFDLGTGPLTLATDGRYSNGKKTEVHVFQKGKAICMFVTSWDGVVDVKSGISPGDDNQLTISDRFYLGGLVGFPGDLFPSVTRIGFQGCLRDFSFGREQINLQNLVSSGLYPECVADERVILVSFNGPHGGYLSRTPIDIRGDFDVTFRFRTKESNGVIVYAANADKSEFVSVMVVRGAVHVVADSGLDRIEVISNRNTYNTGEWHLVAVTKTNRKLTLTVDDSDSTFNRFQEKPSDHVFLVGGFPDDDLVGAAVLPTTSNFIGCISDFMVGVEVLSFTDEVISEAHVIRNSCSIGSNQPILPSFNTTGPDTGTSQPPTPIHLVTSPTDSTATCKLPRVAGAGQQSPEDQGALHFGITENSRQEFPVLDSSYKRNMVMQVELKTVAPNGLIMYTTDTRRIDFTAAYMRNGKVVFAWDYGSGPKSIESPEPVNDGNWHTVVTKRIGALGELIIDNQLVREDEIAGTNRFLRATTPVYFGGLDPFVRDTVRNNHVPPVSRTSFVGCLRGLRLGLQEADTPSGEPDRSIDVQPCTGMIEPGVYFGNGGGYLEQTSSYSIGVNFSMSMSIKPRVSTAILVSVQSPRGDFLSLEMVDGVLYLRCEDSVGPYEASYVPPNGPAFLCDGNWHDIEVSKNRNVLMLTVDGRQGEPGVGSDVAIVADTRDPLYFGGIPDGAVHRGLTTAERFVGCIRDVELRGDPVDFSEVVQVTGDVDTMSCPAN